MNTEKYSSEEDFMISYISSPMVHMISRRRPALDDSFIVGLSTPISKPVAYYEKCIELMKDRGRHPKIAFVFESIPSFYPISLKENRFKWFQKQYIFPSNDPISRYIIENMKLLGEYRICEGNIVRFFVDTKMISHEKINKYIAKIG